MSAATITTKLDDIGLPAWIAVMVVGFIIFWPLGLAVLAYLIWSGRMGCHARGSSRWEYKMQRMQDRMERMKGRMEDRGFWSHSSPSSGNAAFDEYKSETLRRLEEEQKEFRSFLDRLRMSKDRVEFDQFMNERRNAPRGPEGGPAPEPQPQG